MSVLLLLLGFALASTVQALRVLSIASEKAFITQSYGGGFQSSRVDQIRVGFPRNLEPDDNQIAQITSRWDDAYLYTMPPAHGYSNGYGVMDYGYRVAFEDLLPNQRFYVESVTWSTSQLDLPEGSNFNELKSKVDFAVYYQRNENWWWQAGTPSVIDRNGTLLVDMDIDTGLGVNESYSGPFNFTAKNPNPVRSWCIDNYVEKQMNMGIYMGARTVKGGSSGYGWNMDLNLVWEDCTFINQTNWATSVLPAWETCSYRRTANETIRMTQLY
ncbi:hypothetical protein GGR57DRAFT_279710 [Xylariaceae sp. FL1272]|nr:hypothetical protein GGR57DRAFT_279710 [Xylariaceae sp. FL1272]